MRYIIFITVIVTMFVASFPTFSMIVGNTDEEVCTIADPMLDNIFDGIKTEDYAKYSRDFDDTMREALPKKKFQKVNQEIRNQIGNYQYREYLGFLNKNDMTIVLWKGRFDKTKDDILIKLVISKKDERYFVTGLWLQ